MDQISSYKQLGINLIMEHAPQLLLTILTFLIGLWVIRQLTKGVSLLMDKRNVDINLKHFIKSLTSILLKVLLVISVLGMAGVEMTSFIAILGAAGLAIGMALSGTLQNFAGGALILLFKPFKVGDFIDAQGYSGTVKKILVFNTILTTPDNKTIIIPNGGLSTGSMVNYSTEKTRRVDFKFGISYNDDIDKAKSVLRTVVNQNELILKEPEAFIALSELADSSVNIIVRAWVEAPNYWTVYFDTMEKVKKAFDKENISIPFPQRDIHLYNEK